MNTEITNRLASKKFINVNGNALATLWKSLSNLALKPFYSIYEGRLIAKSNNWKKPRHVGIIMDGNRRFAKQLGASDVIYGHQVGANKLKDVLRWCHQIEIPVVTVWALSIDNLKRGEAEVKSLLELQETEIKKMVEFEDIHRNQIRVRFIGKLDLLPETLQHTIHAVENATSGYNRFYLNIAMAYSGRDEIIDAFRNYLSKNAKAGKTIEKALENLDITVVGDYLYTSGIPEPDLIIRTSGEVRISGFLLWQSANSEYYFCDSNWPAFRKIDFLRALRSYDERERRYGL